MIECDNEYYKAQTKVLKDILKTSKEKCKDFNCEIKQQLCKDQIKKFNKFKKCEKNW